MLPWNIDRAEFYSFLWSREQMWIVVFGLHSNIVFFYRISITITIAKKSKIEICYATIEIVMDFCELILCIFADQLLALIIKSVS